MLKKEHHHLKSVLPRNEYGLLIVLACLTQGGWKRKKLSEISGIPLSTLWDYLDTLIFRSYVDSTLPEGRPALYMINCLNKGEKVIDLLRSVWLYPKLPQAYHDLTVADLAQPIY